MPGSVLERVAAGEASAVDECIQRYGGLIWSVVRRFASNHAEAEDAVQEVLIEVWKNSGRFNPQVASESTFITMIARRRVIDRHRRRLRLPETQPIDYASTVTGSDEGQGVEIREEAQLARTALERLRPEEREIIELTVDQGLSQSQIADLKQIPLGTVKTHARRGLARLREMLRTDHADDNEGRPM